MKVQRCNQRKPAEAHRLNSVIIHSETRKPLTRYHVILQLTNFSRRWSCPTLSYRRSYRRHELRYAVHRVSCVTIFACITSAGFAACLSRQMTTANPYRESVSRITTPASYHRPENDNKCDDDELAACVETRRAKHSPPPPPLSSSSLSHLVGFMNTAGCKGIVPASWL